MDENYIRESLTAKSDQLNADDLIAGPQTVRVVEVKQFAAKDQPWGLKLDTQEQPWKPCLSMRRVIATVWGLDSTQWVGRGLIIYRDPDVVYKGATTGGIRISHMSDIESVQEITLTAKRGLKVTYTVNPLGESSEAKETVLDIWRPKLKGAPEKVMAIAKQIAEAYTEKSTAKLDDAHSMISQLDLPTDTEWGPRLSLFAADVFSDIAEGETDGKLG